MTRPSFKMALVIVERSLETNQEISTDEKSTAAVSRVSAHAQTNRGAGGGQQLFQMLREGGDAWRSSGDGNWLTAALLQTIQLLLCCCCYILFFFADYHFDLLGGPRARGCDSRGVGVTVTFCDNFCHSSSGSMVALH